MTIIPEVWTEAHLQDHIDNGIQEDLQLDYKGAGSLDISSNEKKAKTKRELLKDVSAMANSAGGIIIYGIREYQDNDRRHLPERFDPVNQSVVTREWIEQIIGRIRPRLQGVIIKPVPVGVEQNAVVYVVEVPQSQTAHQHPDDKCYYKRSNTVTEKMEDYEIRDVMNRSTQAQIDLVFELEWQYWTTTEERLEHESFVFGRSGGGTRSQQYVTETERVEVKVFAENSGAVYAQYVVGYLYVPRVLIADPNDYDSVDSDLVKVRVDNSQEVTQGMRTVQTRDLPILPGTREEIDELELSRGGVIRQGADVTIRWELSADNARKREGVVQVRDLLASQRRVAISASKTLGITSIDSQRVIKEPKA